MKVALALGGEVDVATGDELHHMGESILGRLDGLERAGRDARPLRRVVNAATTVPGSGVATLDLGSPAVGRLWCPTFVTITGADDSTVVTGATVAWYVGDPAARSLAGLVLPANGTTVPGFADWSIGQVWVHSTDHLFAVVYGAAYLDQLYAAARVLDYPADATEPRRL